MLNVLKKKSTEIRLSDGRIKPFEELQDDEVVAQRLEVGKWFVINRDVIDKNKEEIRRVCNEAGDVGKEYLERFEESNRIADMEPEKYTRIIITYIFKHDWEYKTEQKMRDMCKKIGDGMCDEVICNLELQMRICNGESADLFKKADKLPRVRVIQLRNGETGYFGGGTDGNHNYPSANLNRRNFSPKRKNFRSTPYAFRRKLS